jgi:hypothetical protein
MRSTGTRNATETQTSGPETLVFQGPLGRDRLPSNGQNGGGSHRVRLYRTGIPIRTTSVRIFIFKREKFSQNSFI